MGYKTGDNCISLNFLWRLYYVNSQLSEKVSLPKLFIRKCLKKIESLNHYIRRNSNNQYFIDPAALPIFAEIEEHHRNGLSVTEINSKMFEI